MKRWNKKGQIYILAALIIILVIFWMSLKTNISQTKEVSPSFEQLSQNYENEVNKLVNRLLEKGVTPEELEEEVSQVSGDFVYTYAKQRDPEFGLVHVLSDKDRIVIENNLNSKLVVEGFELASPEESCVEGGISGGAVEIPAGATKRWCIENIDQEILEEWKNQFIYEPTEREISKKDKIIINIGNDDYYFTIGDSVELKAIVRREAEDQVQVYITGEKS